MHLITVNDQVMALELRPFKEYFLCQFEILRALPSFDILT
jgi:hypothetical protein